MTGVNQTVARDEAQVKADLLAYVQRLKANAKAVVINSAAGSDAIDQAWNWLELLTRIEAVALMTDDADAFTVKLRHWGRLLERMNDEVRQGLHLFEAATEAGGQAPDGRHGRAADISTGGADSAEGGRQ